MVINMKQLKTISVVWGLLILVVFTCLTIFALKWKKDIYPYTLLEDKLVTATKKFYEQNYSYPAKGSSIYITYDELKENEMIDELKKDDDTCTGLVKVTMNNVVEYKAYIKCDKYTTKDYDKYIEYTYKK